MYKLDINSLEIRSKTTSFLRNKGQSNNMSFMMTWFVTSATSSSVAVKSTK